MTDIVRMLYSVHYNSSFWILLLHFIMIFSGIELHTDHKFVELLFFIYLIFIGFSIEDAF